MSASATHGGHNYRHLVTISCRHLPKLQCCDSNDLLSEISVGAAVYKYWTGVAAETTCTVIDFIACLFRGGKQI